MKTLALTTLIASVLVNAIAVQAAPRVERLDGHKFFQELSDRAGQ